MTTLADIQALLARDEADEAKIIALLNSQAASLKDMAKQLADALSAQDDAALQSLSDKMTADAEAMEAAAAAVTPPATPTPTPTPDPTTAPSPDPGSTTPPAASTPPTTP